MKSSENHDGLHCVEANVGSVVDEIKNQPGQPAERVGWPGGHGEFLFGFGLYRLIDVAAFTLWIFLMVKANQRQRFRIPVAHMEPL
jgi:hypothetical protein